MSKRIGMNVALGLNSAGFSRGLDRAKGRLDQFGKDVKRQNEVLGKFGAAGLGRGFGMVGGGIEAIGMGGMAGGIGAAAVGIGGLVFALKSAISAIDGMNAAASDARKNMKLFAEGKAEPGTVSGFTPRAAMAPTTQVKGNLFAEAIASNLVRNGSLAEMVQAYALSVAPNVARGVAGEIAAMGMDLLMGREVLNRGRLRGAIMSSVAGDFGAQQIASDYLQAARRGEITEKERAAAERRQAEAMRGN